MAKIQLDKAHKPLIKAAVKLGDWLLALDKLTEQDKQAVMSMQQALIKLPKINDGTLAMYGFSIERGNGADGLVRGWDISLEYFADDAEQQGGLELFSSYIPMPESTDPEVLAQKQQNEAYFHWAIGEVCNFIAPAQAERWIKEVSEPKQFMQPDDRLRIELVYRDYYAEIEY